MTRQYAVRQIAEALAPCLARASEFSRDVYFTWATNILDGIKKIPHIGNTSINRIIKILDKYDPSPILTKVG